MTPSVWRKYGRALTPSPSARRGSRVSSWKEMKSFAGLTLSPCRGPCATPIARHARRQSSRLATPTSSDSSPCSSSSRTAPTMRTSSSRASSSTPTVMTARSSRIATRCRPCAPSPTGPCLSPRWQASSRQRPGARGGVRTLCRGRTRAATRRTRRTSTPPSPPSCAVRTRTRRAPRAWRGRGSSSARRAAATSSETRPQWMISACSSCAWASTFANSSSPTARAM
mmetsp:Transcript_5699/g.13978  ORF Transcript_5699/g.13978 Transcript_5699/m.13978 type:complete len:226 (+) Transcript_5699:299-976(+)